MDGNLEPRRFRKTILAAKILGICAVGWGMHWAGVRGIEAAEAGLSRARAAIAEQFREVEVIREYIPQEQKPLAQIVRDAAKRHGVSPLLLTALITQESGQQLRTDRMRYEAHLHGRFRCERWMNDTECKALSTSWGLGQVIPGFWAKHCKLESYSDLLNPEINLNCSASIIADCLKRRAKVADKMERYRQCLEEYNGSSKYPGEVFAHLTKIVVEQQL